MSTKRDTLPKDILRQEQLSIWLHSLSPGEKAWLRERLLRQDSTALLQGSTFLSRQELLAAESWFWEQIDAANDRREYWSRLRMWLIFMLLRHAALRLSEVFSIEPSHVDWQAGLITVPGAHARTVPLPLEVSHRLGRILHESSLCPMEGPLVRCDASLVRRTMLRCASDCGILKGLLSARGLRHSRALELSKQGLPLPALDVFLGRRSTHNGPIRCDVQEAQRILRENIQKERPMKTSARNVFQGRITSLVQSGILVKVILVTAGGLRLTALITDESHRRLGLAVGMLVNASVKAPWVLISPDADPQGCAENTFTAIIERIRTDDLTMEILAALPEGSQICALQTKGLAQIRAGDKVSVSFKAFSVILSLAS